MKHITRAARCGAVGTAAIGGIFHNQGHTRCMQQNNYEVRRKHCIPFWVRASSSFDRWERPRPSIGEQLQMSRPPPVTEQAITLYKEQTHSLEASHPNKRMRSRLAWPKQAICIEVEKQNEVAKWKSIIEAVGPERSVLAQQLQHTKSEEDKWNIIMAVFATRAAAIHSESTQEP